MIVYSFTSYFFLQIKRRFVNSSLKQRARTAHAYEFRRDFGQVLASQMVWRFKSCSEATGYCRDEQYTVARGSSLRGRQSKERKEGRLEMGRQRERGTGGVGERGEGDREREGEGGL